MDAVSQVDVPMPRRAEKSAIALGSAPISVAGRLVLGIGLGFNHHAIEKAAIWQTPAQPATNELWSHFMGWTLKKSTGEQAYKTGQKGRKA